jgi:glucosamine kinase
MGSIFIGVDGGGTYTRALVVDETGRVLARAEAGGCNPEHVNDGPEQMGRALTEVVSLTGARFGEVAGLVAGVAGINEPKDQAWAERLTALPGLTCPRVHVNDAVVAHAGALGARPGIVAISGTGSIVYGRTETGKEVRNYDFDHYANTSARALAYDVVQRIIAGANNAADAPFVRSVLEFWSVGTAEGLACLAQAGFGLDYAARTQRAGEMARLVTAAADQGVPLAVAVCTEASQALAMGISLVGSVFATEPILVTCIGSAIRSTAMQSALRRELRAASRAYELVEPALSPEAGAALMALRQGGVTVDDAVLDRLSATA